MARVIVGSSSGASGPLVLLYKIVNADMQSTADQAMTIVTPYNSCMPHNLVAIPKTGKATVSCVGGVYDAAAKGGTQIVAASVSLWINLDATSTPKVGLKLGSFGANNNVDATNSVITSQTAFLSLTTGSTGACTADIYIYGFVYS